MNRLIGATIVLLIVGFGIRAQTAPDVGQLTQLLNEFLAGASRNDPDIHDRFWAEDLIYTGSAGRRISKADIMKDVRSPSATAAEEKTTYSAEDVRIQQYGDTAIVAFRLVGKVERGGRTEITRYLNTGTFLKRNGKWQAVSWQATRMPRSELDAKTGLATAEAAFHRATLAADIQTLEGLLDESFIWTHSNGEQVPRAKLLEDLRTQHLKFSSLETNKVTISTTGDTGIVRGVTVRKRNAIPGANAGDAAPFTAYYTLTFVNKNGAWKAVALHTSRQ